MKDWLLGIMGLAAWVTLGEWLVVNKGRIYLDGFAKIHEPIILLVNVLSQRSEQC